MKLFIASDIHGSAYYCEKMLRAYREEKCERLLLLGDLLYHGPRNDLPRDYAPKKVIEQLNALKDDILCVRGNCDAEVDQMVLHFPILAEYALIVPEYNGSCPQSSASDNSAVQSCGGQSAENQMPENSGEERTCPQPTANFNSASLSCGGQSAENQMPENSGEKRAEAAPRTCPHIIFMTHGHIFNESNLPPLHDGDILLHGHTHVPKCVRHENYIYMNPGSVSLPKENSCHGYMTYENGLFIWKDLSGHIFEEFSYF